MGKYDKFLELKNGKRSCTICGKELKEQKDGATSGLIYHFSKVHDVQKLESEKNKRPATSVMENENKKICQPTIAEAFGEWRPEGRKTNECHRAIAQFVCTNGLPFSLVDSPGFRNLMNVVNPRLKIKSRTNLIRYSLPQLYDEYEAKLIEELRRAPFLSISFDGWSDSGNKFQVTGLIVHFIQNDKLVYRVLDIIDSSKDKHTGENISYDIRKVLDYYSIADKVETVIRDGAANAISVTNILDYTNFDCISHKMNLAIKEGVKYFEIGISDLIEKMKKICRKLNKSSNLGREWANIQETLEFSPLLLIKMIEVRWNSLFDMFERALRVKIPLSILLAKHLDLPQIDADEWNTMEEVAQFLRPISKTIVSTQKRGRTASSIIPTMSLLIESTKKITIFPNSRDAVVKKLEEEQKKYKKIEYLNVSSALDPRFKLMFVAASYKEKILNLLMEKSSEDSTEEDNEYANTTELLEDVTEDDEDLLSAYYKAQKTNSEASAVPTSNKAVTLKTELDKWLDEGTDVKIGPVEYWSSTIAQAKYPNLSRLSHKYFCSPAGTVECERTFSAARHLLKENRKRLSVDNFRKTLKLNKNIALMGFES